MNELSKEPQGNEANTLLSVRCLLDELKSKQTENKGGGMLPIDYDIDCVRRTLELLSKRQ